MTKEQFAATLNGRQMGDEITSDEERQALNAGLVVVFGYSDDNVELRGKINEEIGAYDGTTFRVTASGMIAPTWDDEHEEKNLEDATAYFKAKNEPGADIEAVWGEDGYSWTYRTKLPHATFEILEDEEKFCRGIVFSLADIKS